LLSNFRDVADQLLTAKYVNRVYVQCVAPPPGTGANEGKSLATSASLLYTRKRITPLAEGALARTALRFLLDGRQQADAVVREVHPILRVSVVVLHAIPLARVWSLVSFQLDQNVNP
jgi:hypothetical protein